jgi:hypothetical protein
MKCKYETTRWYEGMKRCLGTKEVDPCPGYDKCENYKPNYMTNADRIRAMTDEELAEFLMKLMGHTQCFAEGMFPYHPCPQNQVCKECGIDWLKQPAE